MALAETQQLIADLQLKDNFSKGIGSALGGLGRMESGLGRMSRGAGQVASGLDRLGTRAALAAGAGLAAVVTTAASFEQAFTGIEKTVDATEPELAKLNETFREMARTIPVSFEELAGIGEQGGALGIATQDLEEFTDVVARLSVSTNLSSDEAATALGHLGTVLHLSGGEFRDFADSLVNLGNKGASTEGEIVELANRFAAAGNSAGLSKEDILGLASAVASMGIQVEAGGSSLSRVFNSVATNIGTSSDKAVAFADAMGLSAKEFRDAWEKDAVGTFEDFLRTLGKLDQFEAAKVLKDIGLTNSRDIAAVRLMSQNVDFVAQSLHDAADGQNALNVESQKFFDTTAGQWQVLKNNVRDAGVTIGNELLPIVKELVQEFSDFLNQPGTRARLQEFGQSLAKGIRTVVDELKGADFSGFIDGMKLAATVARGAFDAFRALPPQVQQLAIAALVANKVSGGAVGQIAKGLFNIGAGALQTFAPKLLGSTLGGVLGGRGSTPAFPVFVSVVGPGGLLGGAPVLGGGAAAAGGGILAGIGGLPGLGLILATLGGSASALKSTIDATEDGAVDLSAAMALMSGPGGVIGLLVDDLLGIKHDLIGGRPPSPQSSTPLGQFTPLNAGGTPVPVKVTNPGTGADNAAALAIKETHKGIVRALGHGDIKEAIRLKELSDIERSLRGLVDKRTNDIIPGIGRTNRGLAVANRNLQDGNARQRTMAQNIREARDATRSGFDKTDRQLGVLNSKDFSPDVNVTVPVTSTVSINDIIRSETFYNAALSRSSQTRSGFKPTT